MNKITVVGLVGQSVFLPVDHFHVGEETLEASSFLTQPGGKGFNQAVAAARFEADVTFCSAVGNDGYIKTASDWLVSEGITPILVEKKGQTAYAVILTDKGGRNHVTEYIGVSLAPEDVKHFESAIAMSHILMLSNEIPENVGIACAEIARQHHVQIILNPAPFHSLSKRYKQMIDLFTPNEHECEGLNEYNNVIETLGGRGCRLRMTGQIIPAQKVKAVDTTGAGDTFNGVLAAMLAQGRSIEEAARIANEASGISVTRPGAVTSIPNISEMESCKKLFQHE